MSTYEVSVKRLLNKPEHLIQFGLERTRELLERLGNPHLNYQCFHVAGTNGKGSTCAMLASILKVAGKSFGVNTSPHLFGIRERIAFGDRLISESEFASLESTVNDAAMKMAMQPSFFEKIYAMACLAFSNWGVEYAVVEVGCGGRLDATNVCQPIVCGITSIGLDHQKFLGDTLEKIATEKAGIIKSGVPVIDGCSQINVQAIIRQRAMDLGAPYQLARKYLDRVPELILSGAHQRQNAAVAWAMVEASGADIGRDVIEAGLSKATWPGRYEKMGNVIFDGAHNAEAAQALVATIQDDPDIDDRVDFLLGFSTGHDPAAFVKVLLDGLTGRDIRIFVTSFEHDRMESVEDVMLGLAGCSVPVIPYAKRSIGDGSAHSTEPSGLEQSAGSLAPVRNADYANAQSFRLRDDIPLIVSGSLYLVGEMRARFKARTFPAGFGS